MLLNFPGVIDALLVLMVACELSCELSCPCVDLVLLLCTLLVGIAVLMDCLGPVDVPPVLAVCEVEIGLFCPDVTTVLLML